MFFQPWSFTSFHWWSLKNRREKEARVLRKVSGFFLAHPCFSALEPSNEPATCCRESESTERASPSVLSGSRLLELRREMVTERWRPMSQCVNDRRRRVRDCEWKRRSDRNVKERLSHYTKKKREGCFGQRWGWAWDCWLMPSDHRMLEWDKRDGPEDV